MGSAGMNGIQGGWQPDNLTRIQAALAALPAPEEREKPFCAVFDFDNTCVFRDIGQAVFRVQLLELRYRIPPKTLADLIPEEGGALQGKPWALAREAVLAQYRRLWPLIAAERRAEAQAVPAYRHFVALFAWLVASARRLPQLGPCYVLSLLAKLQTGYTIAEQQDFCTRVLAQAQKEPLEEVALRTELPAPLGELCVLFPKGFRPFAEMRELMQVLQAHGVLCRIVSASSEWLVQTAAPALGFPLKAAEIFGVRTRLAADGTILPEDAPGWPLTFRGGKTEVIDRCIGGQVWMTAGDADTDYEMLIRPGVSIRLLINRNSTGLIASLYERPDILLQGLDQKRGCFRPFRETVG